MFMNNSTRELSMREVATMARCGQAPKARYVYVSPQMFVYGHLADLTAAGSNTPAESNGVNCTSMANKLNTMCAQ